MEPEDMSNVFLNEYNELSHTHSFFSHGGVRSITGLLLSIAQSISEFNSEQCNTSVCLCIMFFFFFFGGTSRCCS